MHSYSLDIDNSLLTWYIDQRTGERPTFIKLNGEKEMVAKFWFERFVLAVMLALLAVAISWKLGNHSELTLLGKFIYFAWQVAELSVAVWVVAVAWQFYQLDHMIERYGKLAGFFWTFAPTVLVAAACLKHIADADNAESYAFYALAGGVFLGGIIGILHLLPPRRRPMARRM